MSSPYFNLKVVEITRETSDAITLHFEHPERKHITYKPGQFLTLIIPFEGREVRRSYSLSSTPHEAPQLAVTIKRVAGGVVSGYLLDHVKVGDEIKVMEPLGNFCLTHSFRVIVCADVLVADVIGFSPLRARGAASLPPIGRGQTDSGRQHEPRLRESV